MSSFIATVLPALGLSSGGLVVAYDAWARRRRVWPKLGLTLFLWVFATYVWCRGFGVEVGIPLALESAALVALGAILLRAERRPAKEAKDRTVEGPEPAPWRRTRAFLRFLVAGPLAFTVAVAVSVLLATEAPLNEQTRLVIAGLMIPSLWAVLIVAALAVRRLWLTGGIYLAAILLIFGLMS